MAPKSLEPPASFTAWLKLFAVYAAIYLEAHPSEAGSVLSYVIRILDLQTNYEGTIWRAYDERFRRLREKCPGSLPWHQIHWAIVMELNGHMQQTSSQTQMKAAGCPNGACHAFFYKGHCKKNACKRPHLCGICLKQGHSRDACWQGNEASADGQSKNSNSTSHKKDSQP